MSDNARILTGVGEFDRVLGGGWIRRATHPARKGVEDVR